MPISLSTLKMMLALSSGLLLATCQRVPSTLEQVLALKELRVVTRNSPTAYYFGAEGPEGPEYDMVKAFAAELGVALYVYTVPTLQELRRQVASGRAHIAAAGISATRTWGRGITFGPPYHQVRQHVIYSQGEHKPRSLQEINGSDLEVAAGSAQAEALKILRAERPREMADLVWIERRGDALDMLKELAEGHIEYTLADSTEFYLGRNLYPQIRVAFDLTPGESLAWAFNSRDHSLVRRARKFFTDITLSGLRAQILKRYYGQSDQFKLVATRNFVRDIQTLLPRFRRWFEESAARIGEDWRVLAAIGYQESRWEPSAVSFTGVRGLMMLTDMTARQLGVENRDDAHQSIDGGARYYASVREKIPDRIPEPDRTWLALAAYNVGFGHLEDARILAQSAGRNPDSWQEVRNFLPLLAQEQWYLQTKRGYARGWEPVRFVDNIRNYLDILEWAAADSG